MDAHKLFTLSFEKNVGPRDRVARLVSGGGLVAAGLMLNIPLWAGVALGTAGVMWALTGVLSRCSIYYLLGYSTCPVGGAPNPRATATH